MLIICPKCKKRHELQKSNQNITISCDCGETLTVLPWLSYREVISEQMEMKCPLCNRSYDLTAFRDKTEIACSCGNLFPVR